MTIRWESRKDCHKYCRRQGTPHASIQTLVAVQLALYMSGSFILSFWLWIEICQTHSLNLINPFCFIRGSRRKQKLCHDSATCLMSNHKKKQINRAVIILFHCWIVIEDLIKLMPYEPVMGRFVTQLRKNIENIPRVKYSNWDKRCQDKKMHVCEKKNPCIRHGSCLQTQWSCVSWRKQVGCAQQLVFFPSWKEALGCVHYIPRGGWNREVITCNRRGMEASAGGLTSRSHKEISQCLWRPTVNFSKAWKTEGINQDLKPGLLVVVWFLKIMKVTT